MYCSKHTVLFTQRCIKLKRPTSSTLFLSLSFMTLSGDFFSLWVVSQHTLSLLIPCLLFFHTIFLPVTPEVLKTEQHCFGSMCYFFISSDFEIFFFLLFFLSPPSLILQFEKKICRTAWSLVLSSWTLPETTSPSYLENNVVTPLFSNSFSFIFTLCRSLRHALN